jgi:hypothetical protein
MRPPPGAAARHRERAEDEAAVDLGRVEQAGEFRQGRRRSRPAPDVR